MMFSDPYQEYLVSSVIDKVIDKNDPFKLIGFGQRVFTCNTTRSFIPMAER